MHHRLPRMCTHPSVFTAPGDAGNSLHVFSCCWSFLGRFSPDFRWISLLIPSHPAECRFPTFFSESGVFAPGTAGENSSKAAGDKSPGHVTSDSGNLHLANPAGQSTGRSSLQYQGTDYTIIDESIPEQALYLTQGDPLLELVSFPEALQIELSNGKGPAVGKSSASATQAKQSKSKPHLQAPKDSGSLKRGGGSSHRGGGRGGRS